MKCKDVRLCFADGSTCRVQNMGAGKNDVYIIMNSLIWPENGHVTALLANEWTMRICGRKRIPTNYDKALYMCVRHHCVRGASPRRVRF